MNKDNKISLSLDSNLFIGFSDTKWGFLGLFCLYRRLTEFGPPMWQAEADTELTLSASPATAVGEQTLTLANRRYSTVILNINLVKIIDYIYNYRILTELEQD